jgi:hypothetical protein
VPHEEGLLKAKSLVTRRKHLPVEFRFPYRHDGGFRVARLGVRAYDASQFLARVHVRTDPGWPRREGHKNSRSAPLGVCTENEPDRTGTTLSAMAVTEQELLGEITDVLVWLTRGETLLVRCLQEIRFDMQSVEARATGFAPLVSPPAIDPPTDTTPPTSTKADIELVPTLQVLVEPPSVEPGDLPLQETPSPGAKRDYDFFADLDRKLARLTVADQGPHDTN